MRQRVEGRGGAGTGSFVYVEGVITGINHATKQYTVQLVGEEMVGLFLSLWNLKKALSDSLFIFFFFF